jgi:hypothetical protein
MLFLNENFNQIFYSIYFKYINKYNFSNYKHNFNLDYKKKQILEN